MAQFNEGNGAQETTISVSWTQSSSTGSLVAVAHCNTLNVFRSTPDSYVSLVVWKAPSTEALRLCCWFSANPEHPLLAVTSDSKKLFLVDPASPNAAQGAGELPFPFVTTAKKVSALRSLPADSARGIPSAGLVVGDKFGDVYLYRTTNSTGATDWDRTSEPKFLLQHLSIISAVGLIPPPLAPSAGHIDVAGVKKSSWRILSCDKDDHIRVSRYPDTFYIDNYLWNPQPAAVTSLAVAESVNSRGEYILAVGTDAGTVSFWSIAPTGIVSPTESSASGQPQAALEKFLCTYSGAEGCGAVVGLDALTGAGNHPSSFAVAFLKDPNVHFINSAGLLDGRVQLTQHALRAPPLLVSGDALASAGTPRVLALDRSGALSWLTGGSSEKKGLPGNISDLSDAWGVPTLEAVNVAAHWKEPVIDPRAKKGAKGNSDDEEAGEEGGDADDADGPSKKKQRN